MSQAHKRHFKAVYDDDQNMQDMGRVKLIHKSSSKVKMVATETCDGLYEIVMELYNRKVHVAKGLNVERGHERQVYCRHDTLRDPLVQTAGVFTRMRLAV